MTDSLATVRRLHRCPSCGKEAKLERTKQKPGSSRWSGTCAACGTEITVTMSEETSTKKEDVDWQRKAPEEDKR